MASQARKSRGATKVDPTGERVPPNRPQRKRRCRKYRRRVLVLELVALVAVVTAVVVGIVAVANASVVPPPPPINTVSEPEDTESTPPYSTSNMALIAAGELGNTWDKYGAWWGFTERDEWCAIFICWCAEQAGYKADVDYIYSLGENTDIGKPKDSGEGAGCHARFHDKNKRYKTRESGYIPKSGDLIYFDWDMNNEKEGPLVMDHIGIVDMTDEKNVYTIEGNSASEQDDLDLVRRKSYPLTDPRIRGYSDMSGITEIVG